MKNCEEKSKRFLIGIFLLMVFTMPIKLKANVYYIFIDNLSVPEQMLIKSIQGIVNQKVKNGDESLHSVYTINRDVDLDWLVDYRSQYGFSTNLKQFSTLYSYGKQYIDNYVLWSPGNTWTLNIACTYAALHQAMVLTPQLASDLNIAAEKTLLMDFTQDQWYYPDMNSGAAETITGKLDGYTWAMNHLLPQCDSTKIITLKDNIPDLRDMIFFDNIFTINLDPLNNEDEIALLNTILSQYPVGATMLGWADGSFATEPGQDEVTVERAFVKILSENNMYFVPSDYANNLSFHGLFDFPSKLEQQEKAGKYEQGKKYVCFIASDGDNLQYDMNYMRTKMWENSYRGKVPVGWTISPRLYEFAPFIAWYYYNSAAQDDFNDTFVAGPSGFSYAYPSSLDDNALIDFLQKTDMTMKEMDMSCIVSIDITGKEQETYQKFAEHTSAKGVFLTEKEHNAYLPEYDYVFQSGNHDLGLIVEMVRVDDQPVSDLVNQIRLNAFFNKFVFVYFNVWFDNLDIIYGIYQDLKADTSYRVVGPAEFMDCLMQYHLGTAIEPDNSSKLTPSDLTLHQNYPNPFNPETVIAYTLPAAGEVELNVLNTRGQKIKTLINNVQSTGKHQVKWDGTDDQGRKVSSGIYFYQIKFDNKIKTKKMILLQ
ncbi:GxGYxYP domain-containing protein [Caldithrix abyssi]